MPEQFTTWKALYEAMLNDLASGHWRRVGSYSVAGRSVSYRSFAEFKSLLEYAKEQADTETGVCFGRTVARPVGRQEEIR